MRVSERRILKNCASPKASWSMAVDPAPAICGTREWRRPFDEINNRITAGQNNGRVQVMGPVSRVAQFKMIADHAAPSPPGCSRSAGRRPTSPTRPPRRWRASSCCRAPTTAIRSFRGSTRSRQRRSGFSPAGHSGANTTAICLSARRDRLSPPATCCASTCPRAGAAWRSRIPASRTAWPTTRRSSIRPRAKPLRFGTGFGVGTDIQTGPNGNLFVVSLSNGAVYEIHRVH